MGMGVERQEVKEEEEEEEVESVREHVIAVEVGEVVGNALYQEK